MNSRIDTYDDLYNLLREKLEYKYGLNPKSFVVNRFEEEMEYIKKHDISKYFIRYYNILRNLINKDIPFGSNEKRNNSFLASRINRKIFYYIFTWIK